VTGTPRLCDRSISEYLEALASKNPTPGGGAAAALSLAQASALAQMVIEYSIGRPSLAAHEPSLRKARSTLADERLRAVALMDEDAAAYAALSSILGMPKNDPARPALLRKTATDAIAPPSEVLDRATRLLELVADLVHRTSPSLRSDLGVAGAEALAAAEGAAFNVRANLPLLGDDREGVDRAHGAALARARDAKARLDAAIELAAARR